MYPSAQDLRKPATKDEPIKIKVAVEATTNNKEEQENKKESISSATDNKNMNNHSEVEKLEGKSKLKKLEPDIPEPDYDSDPVRY